MREKLGNKKEVALRHFIGLVKKFEREPMLFKVYREVLDGGYLEKGIVERCVTEGLADESLFYLLYKAVVREENVSSLLRIAFNGVSFF
ncbi:integrase catalytic domain-containing protein [Nephila pilipes]|uniref:Integrase catalytic domain-containing protein n=1 Tax=Nephila pilipes TaxID=299642 RepID=A0A8X6PHT3_NEPPI|nr:integrase catalytic domain-containing protein [Nephila pilipes]